MNIQNLRQRVELAMAANGLHTWKELADKSGITVTVFPAWWGGRKSPDMNSVAKLAKALNTTVSALLDESPVTVDDILNPKGTSSNYTRVETPQMTEELKIYGKVPADHLKGTVAPIGTVLVEVKYKKDKHYCLQVHGRSMYPYIMEGDICIVEKVDYRLEALDEDRGPAHKQLWKSLHKEIVVAIVDNEDPILKRIRVRDDKKTGFKLWLSGDNPNSEQIDVTRETYLYVIGIVRKIMRDTKNVE